LWRKKENQNKMYLKELGHKIKVNKNSWIPRKVAKAKINKGGDLIHIRQIGRLKPVDEISYGEINSMLFDSFPAKKYNIGHHILSH